MAHPRATFPPSVIDYYRKHGCKATEIAYRTSWQTLRRWLVERGVPIRKHGLRVGRKAQP
jgi:hypothetical protein